MRNPCGYRTPRSLQDLARAMALADVCAPNFATIASQIGRIIGFHSFRPGSRRPLGRLLHNKTVPTCLPPLVQSAPWRTISSTAC